MEELYNDRLLKVENQLKMAFPPKIDTAWVKTVSGEKNPLGKLSEYDAFCRPARDLLERGGKRWRPVLMLLSCELTGGGNASLELTPLVEFPHNGSLIIDDIEDKSELRRGKKSIHLIYGDDFAINAGNLLYYLPTVLIDNSNQSAERKLLLYRYYSENMRRLHLGQGLDILWHNSTTVPDPDEYEQMCRFKTGALARLAAQTGVIAGGGTTEEAAILGNVCENMGVGFQIMDDVVNLTRGNPGKGRGDDIVEGKKSLPVIYHIQDNPDDVGVLNKLFFKAKEKGLIDGNKEIQEAIAIMEDSGSVAKAENRAKDLLNQSAETIREHFEQSEAGDLIIYMIKNFA